MTTPPSPDPAPDAGEPGAEPGWLAGVRVPDDARDLEHDREAWVREQTAARRRARWQRIFLTRRWEAYGISGPLVGVALAVVALAAFSVALLVPAGRGPTPRAAALSTSTVPAGTIGGLLPDAALTGAGQNPESHGTRDPALRPALIALIPTECMPAACRAAMTDAELTARENGLTTFAVGSSAAQLIDLSVEPADGGGYSIPEVDESGTVLRTFGITGAETLPTLLAIDTHGVVRSILRSYTEKSGYLLGDLQDLAG